MLEQGSTSMDDMSVRCARHVIGENDRTLGAAECIRQSNWVEFGRLLDESHASLKHDFAVSCVELDAAVEIAQRIGPEGGVFGCRMTGGGFGGCAVALIETAAQRGIVRDIRANYLDRTGIGATLFLSRPAGGASLVKL
jgi:galactokinase